MASSTRRRSVSPMRSNPHIKKNSVGGIAVDEAELKAAFEFFDVSGKGKITLSDLKQRLGAFYKNVPLREYKFLMNNQSELTLDDLRTLLENNEIKNFMINSLNKPPHNPSNNPTRYPGALTSLQTTRKTILFFFIFLKKNGAMQFSWLKNNLISVWTDSRFQPTWKSEINLPSCLK